MALNIAPEAIYCYSPLASGNYEAQARSKEKTPCRPWQATSSMTRGSVGGSPGFEGRESPCVPSALHPMKPVKHLWQFLLGNPSSGRGEEWTVKAVHSTTPGLTFAPCRYHAPQLDL